jgi:hypothetical protein
MFFFGFRHSKFSIFSSPFKVVVNKRSTGHVVIIHELSHKHSKPPTPNIPPAPSFYIPAAREQRGFFIIVLVYSIYILRKKYLIRPFFHFKSIFDLFFLMSNKTYCIIFFFRIFKLFIRSLRCLLLT